MHIEYYTYDGGAHCRDCARERFGDLLNFAEPVDSAGEPVGAVHDTDRGPLDARGRRLAVSCATCGTLCRSGEAHLGATRVECQNCDWRGPADDCGPIKDIWERVAPGEPMPWGECPECGSLCQAAKAIDWLVEGRNEAGHTIIAERVAARTADDAKRKVHEAHKRANANGEGWQPTLNDCARVFVEPVPQPEAPPAHEARRLDMVCETCFSSDVRRDAWAEWSLDDQDWVLGQTFDDAYCETCGGETNLIEMDPDAAQFERDKRRQLEDH